MGRILEYVVLLSNLSLILGAEQLKEPTRDNNYERGKQENFTHAVRQFYPMGQNEFFSKRALPLDYQLRRRLQSSGPKQMVKFIGLHAFSSDGPERKNQKRNHSEPNLRNSNLPKRNAPGFTQGLYPRMNSKNPVGFHGEIPSQKLTRVYSPYNSENQQKKRAEDISRRHNKEGRSARYHPRHAAKICDPCNSVPWVPLLKVADSYRQQRTHVTELHPTPQQNFNFDYHGFASNSHDVLLPPIPLVPPLEPIYDGTISSSFGLPVGNIPTSHGLLAPPINHLDTKINKYIPSTIDYSSPFNYYSPQGLLESNPFPELSPVPVVPIHDSGQFFHFDSSIPDLVPPPTKNLDVSKVVLTISEENSGKPQVFHNHKPATDLSSASTSVDSQAPHLQGGQNNHNKDFGRLEIVKSIPLAEFTSSSTYQHSELPLYPPLHSEFPKDFGLNEQKPVSGPPTSNLEFLVPPAKSGAEVNFNSDARGVQTFSRPPPQPEPQGESSAPKPLTSPSLSWLFSDHTAPPEDSKSTASVLSFAAETQEIASVVNNELRPVSPQPFPVSSENTQNVGNTKSKKIQIIIPYTTKNKNGHDNNALESVRHEVFQPPVSKSTSENNSLRDIATPALPPLTHRPEPTSQDRKVIDGFESQREKENQDEEGKKISEMQHIIASNIRELLRDEIEKLQNDQNYPLQKNIHDWTALEYSNHKTVGAKVPKDTIAQALAVTSIPGTSISHLLLPSKKIPNEYFKTTPVPVYDEPATTSYKTTSATVNSSPFTAKPYATTNVYNPTKSFRESAKQNKENTPPVANHERNYTEITRGRVNQWGRLNENLVLPEARTKSRRVESTTSAWSSPRIASSGTEKVQIVTPISLTTLKNHTTTPFRRTTRHARDTESPTTEIPTQFLNMSNSTKLEKVPNRTFPFNRRFAFNLTTTSNASSTTPSPSKAESTNSSASEKEAVVSPDPTDILKNQTSEEVRSRNEHVSINDIFPFRNKQLPWESNLNASEYTFQTGRQRKSLIKQSNLPKSRTAPRSS